MPYMHAYFVQLFNFILQLTFQIIIATFRLSYRLIGLQFKAF